MNETKFAWFCVDKKVNTHINQSRKDTKSNVFCCVFQLDHPEIEMDKNHFSTLHYSDQNNSM